MNDLLDRLRSETKTLTIFNYGNGEETLDVLASHLAGKGVALRTDRGEHGTPRNLAAFHSGDEVLAAMSVSELVPGNLDFEQSFDAGENPIDLPVDGTSVSVSVESDVDRMVTVSRTLERRALREGDGNIRAGFQDISMLRNSERTRSVYERLADAGVDTVVFGYPDTDLGEAPYTVYEDHEGAFRDYWFLLYDGGGNPDRKGALVSREVGDGTYESYWTVDPATVDDLFELADERYPELARS